MAPYFETVKSFADVPVNAGADAAGVDTAQFLAAADGLVTLFDLLGSGVFAFVQSDLRSNIGGVRAQHAAAPAEGASLEGLVRHEAAAAGHHAKHGTACLVRLVRGLAFTCQALQETRRAPGAELHACFLRAYDTVLRRHHTFVVRAVVSVALRAVPRRADFFAAIAQGGDARALDAALGRWLGALDALVVRLSAFLAEGGHGRV